MIPTVRQLFAVGVNSGPYAYVIREMAQHEDGLNPPIFRPWCGPLEANGELGKERLREILHRWHGEDQRAPWLMQVDPLPEPERPFTTTSVDPPKRPRVFGMTTDVPNELGWRPISIEGSLHVYGGWHCVVDIEEACLVSPLALGTDCEIRHGARVTWSVLGHRVHIAGRVSRSAIGDDTRVEPGAVIGDAVIGARCLIGASVVIRSDDALKADRREVVITDYTDPTRPRIRTGRIVLGAIIGDGCRVFDSLEPGTVLLSGCHVRKGMNLPAGIYSPEMLDELAAVQSVRIGFELRMARKLVAMKDWWAKWFD